jgi:pimeloyl-ACP methyl ester carboxylesterase
VGHASWSAQAPALADAGHRVHVPERRGHAHTPDVPGPLTYDAMADDTVAYLDGVVGGRAHLVEERPGRWWACWRPSAARTWWTGWC